MPQHGPVYDQRLHYIINIIGIHTCRLSPCSIEITFSDSISIKEYVLFVALNPGESIDNRQTIPQLYFSSLYPPQLNLSCVHTPGASPALHTVAGFSEKWKWMCVQG